MVARPPTIFLLPRPPNLHLRNKRIRARMRKHPVCGNEAVSNVFKPGLLLTAFKDMADSLQATVKKLPVRFAPESGKSGLLATFLHSVTFIRFLVGVASGSLTVDGQDQESTTKEPRECRSCPRCERLKAGW